MSPANAGIREVEAGPESPGLQSIVVVGPTASGKTALAIELALLLGDAEIISVDSMQVYRRMDIGTGTATPAERRAVPHHLIDVVEPSEEFSVSWFQREASAAMERLATSGRRAILVGGTGLYHRAVVDRLDIPGEYPEIRAALEAEVAGDGTTGRTPGETTDETAGRTTGASTRLAGLYRRLVELDPVAAARCEPTNSRRIIRALEVVLGSGRRFSSFGPGLEAYPSTGHLMVGLRPEREALGSLVAARVEAMMAAGFLDEVRSLADEPADLSRTARQALGYRELLDHLQGGRTRDDAVAETIMRTRQFAVRQDRWFRRDPRIGWYPSPVATADATEAECATKTRSLAQLIAGSVSFR